MAKRKLIVICQSGGQFTRSDDGTLSYSGGDAHALSINDSTCFEDFKSEIAEMWKHDSNSLSIKYLLPNNKRTLITLSCDKDMQNMIEFHEDSSTVDVYVMVPAAPTLALTPALNYIAASDTISVPCTRSSRTTAAELASSLSGPSDFVADAEDVEQPKLSSPWKNCITGVGQHFNGVKELREALRKYALAHGFLYAFKKNNGTRRVSVKCKAEGCPWFIVASKLSTSQLFKIKKMNEAHTCGMGPNSVGRCHASTKLLASIMKEKLQNSPNYRPREIAAEIQRDFGIELDYSQAYRAIETAREELQGSCKEAYNRLPWLCEKIIESNPNSFATLIRREDLSFHCIFVAFHALILGYQNGCRPLLFLDSLALKSKYRGELLTASSLDGNDAVFPVAFAIVDELSNDNWHWFLLQLKAVFSTSQCITFVADRNHGISESLPQVFENCYHGYCLHYLTEELIDKMRGQFSLEVLRVIGAELCNAAYASTVDGFKKYIETIKNISPKAYEWVLQSDPEHWANAFFKGSRYNHLKSNIAVLFYDWVSDQPAATIIQVVETLRRKLMELIYTRRVDSDGWSSRLTPSLEEKLRKNTINSRSFEVLFSHSSTYEVRDTFGVINVVNLERWECSCREWQITGLPCSHVVAVFECTGKDVYDCCSKYFTVEAFRLAYVESINPVPTGDEPLHSESSLMRVHPPCIRRPSGRPKDRRNLSKGVLRRPLHCSKCGKLGHNKVSCKNSCYVPMIE